MSSFSDLVNRLSKRQKLAEKAPAGFEGTVKAMKKHGDIDNPYALTNWMKNKGYKSHRKKSGAAKNESIIGCRVDHPTKGQGVVVSLSESLAGIRWDRLDLRMKGTDRIGPSEAKHVIVLETYKSDPKDAKVEKKSVKKKADKKPVKKGKKIDEAIAAIPGMSMTASEPKTESNFGLSWADLGLVFEEDEDAPAASTGGEVGNNDLNNDNVEEMPVSSQSPLSTEGGFESASEGGEDNFEMPDDALDVPTWKQMEQPGQGNTRSAEKSGDASAGNGSKETSFGKKNSGSSEKSDDSSEGESKEDKFAANKFKKKTEESKKLSARALLERMTWADADIERITECDCEEQAVDECHDKPMRDGVGGMPTQAPKQMPNPSMMNEHDMAAGEIAVTQDFLVKLLKAVVRSKVADDKMSMIAQAVAECCEEDRTLDVADIATVMGKLKELQSGGSPVSPGMDVPGQDMVEPSMDAAPAEEPAAEPEEAPAEEPAEKPDFGAEEDGRDEGSSDEGEESEPAEEPAADDSEASDEGSEESDRDEDSEDSDEEFEDKAEGDGETAGEEGGAEHEGKTKLMSSDEPEEEEKPVNEGKRTKKGKKNLKEFAIAPIKHLGQANDSLIREEGRDDEKELAMIKRRAGLQDWWK